MCLQENRPLVRPRREKFTSGKEKNFSCRNCIADIKIFYSTYHVMELPTYLVTMGKGGGEKRYIIAHRYYCNNVNSMK